MVISLGDIVNINHTEPVSNRYVCPPSKGAGGHIVFGMDQHRFLIVL